jgi:HK97 family phage portal protein
MKFMDRVRNVFYSAAVKAQKLTFIPSWVRAAWMEVSFDSLVRNGYKASSAVFGCVRALAFSFPEPELVVWRSTPIGAQPEPEHPLRKLLERPNPDMGEAEFDQYAVTYAAVGGNCYVWKERSADGRVIALWPFHDGNMSAVPGKNSVEGLVAYYEYDPGDGHKVKISKKDVVHWKWMVDPEKPWRGMGAIEAAAKDVDSDVESTRYVYSLLKNDAIPRVAVTLVEGDELTEAKAERLGAAWLEKYGGENRGMPAFLEAGMSIHRLGMNMQELSMEALKEVPESRICAAFGVPPVIASLLVGLKRSDYGDGQARKAFTETTLAALWRSFASELQAGLVDDFGGGVYLKFDMNQVRALQENVGELWTRIDRAVINGYITRAEARRAIGFSASDVDEVYRETLTAMWVDAAEKPSTSPPAPLRNGEGGEEEEQSADDADGADETSPPAPSPKRRGEEEEKAASLVVYGRSLQRIRKTTAVRMQADIDEYFAKLADRVVSRAHLTPDPSPKRRGGEDLTPQEQEEKELPSVDDLLTPEDERSLGALLKRWYIAIIEASWETMNLSLGVTVAFDLTDPAVTRALAGAGKRVKEIIETTRQELENCLKYANENGWSIGRLVRGDDEQRGIRDIVEQTYKGRAETVARTELGEAQNRAAAERYKASGVGLVEILDNGNDDDDEPCKIAAGQNWTTGYFGEHLLEHPRCTRAGAPYFGDREPDRS